MPLRRNAPDQVSETSTAKEQAAPAAPAQRAQRVKEKRQGSVDADGWIRTSRRNLASQAGTARAHPETAGHRPAVPPGPVERRVWAASAVRQAHAMAPRC